MATTQSVSYVKAHLAEVIDSVRGSRDPITITQNGSPSAVIIDHESYQRTRDTLAILKLVAMGEHDVTMGRTVSQTKVIRDARAKLEKRLTEQDHQG